MDIVISQHNGKKVLERIIEQFNTNKLEATKENNNIDLISLIDSSEISLNIDNAQSICEKINNILEEKDIDLIIEPEDLFNPPRYYAKEKVESYIAELDKQKQNGNYIIDLDDLDDLEFLLNEYDLMDKKIKVYEIIGDIYFEARDYEKECEYMSKAWELTTRYPKRKLNYRIMIKLANNYIYRGKYQEAIRLYEKALLNIENIPEKYLMYLYYNYALAYSRLNMYSNALEIISDLLRFTERKDYDLWAKTYILKGNCYFEIEDYELALSNYNNALQVLTFTGYSEAKYIIYGNISETYTKLNDKVRAYKYIDEILNNIDNLNKDSYRYSIICNQLGVSYENLGQLGQAEKYYKKSLEYAKKNIQHNYISKNIISLMELNKNTDVENIFEIIEKSNDDIIPNIKLNDDLLAVFKSLKILLENQQYSRIQAIINHIINKEDK